MYSDGSAHEREGLPGGWAFVVVRGDDLLLTQSGAAKATNGNVMELTGALEGLTAVQERGWHLAEPVELVCDSRFTLAVAAGTERPRAYAALAEGVRVRAGEVAATLRWVKAHSAERWNEHVDALAREAKQGLVPQRVKQKQAQRRGARRG